VTAAAEQYQSPDALPPTVLVVDDSPAQRRILAIHLGRWGYRVKEAGSAREALDLCSSSKVDMVISDWMMPGMSGLDLCRVFRTLERDNYGYFILLTSRSGKAEIAQGLDVGADDFLAKPVAPDELRARLRAGERILDMAAELSRKNAVISKSLEEINTLYGALDRDLREARQMQQSLVRDQFRDYGLAQVSLMLRSSGHVGGDLVGAYPAGSDGVGLFAFDVSGHGVASALMTARLAAYFSGSNPEQNMGLTHDAVDDVVSRLPVETALALNEILAEGAATDIYVTALLGHVDVRTGVVRFVQCGYPPPVVLLRDGGSSIHGDGGLPIGLIDGAEWLEQQILLSPGDRLIWASDGWEECPDTNGNQLGEDALVALWKKSANLPGIEFVDAALEALTQHAGKAEFPDDLSMLVLDYLGSGQKIGQVFPVSGTVEKVKNGTNR